MNGSKASEENDFLAVEEPLEIRVEDHSVAVVMRTPGDDRELAAGFLISEGLVKAADDIIDILRPHCLFSEMDATGSPPAGEDNAINVLLRKPASLDFKRLTRHLFTSSSCGICSKASIEAVRQQFPSVEDDCQVDPQTLMGLPEALGSAQETFKNTGGLHACALFDRTGKLLVLREDVGRHNALDKVVGWALLGDRLPLRQHILLLSGRTSFEMMQKALAAGLPIVAAISALRGNGAPKTQRRAVGFAVARGVAVLAAGRGLRAPPLFVR